MFAASFHPRSPGSSFSTYTARPTLSDVFADVDLQAIFSRETPALSIPWNFFNSSPTSTARPQDNVPH